MSAEEKHIREFAYQIWQSEGCPHVRKSVTGRWLASWSRPKRGPVAKPATRARKTTDDTEGQGSAGCEAARAVPVPRLIPPRRTPTPRPAPETIKKTRTPRKEGKLTGGRQSCRRRFGLMTVRADRRFAVPS